MGCRVVDPAEREPRGKGGPGGPKAAKTRASDALLPLSSWLIARIFERNSIPRISIAIGILLTRGGPSD